MKLGISTLALVAAGLVAPVLHAQFVWTGAAADGVVTNPKNWQGGVAPSGLGTDNVTFGDIPSLLQMIDVPASGFALHNLTFLGSARPAYEFSGGAPAPTFTLTGDLSVSATDSGANVILDNSLNVALTGGSHTISTGYATVFANGQIGETGGSASLVKNGSGTLILAGSNTFSGDLTVNQGLLTLSGSLSASGTTLNGGTILLLGGSTLPGSLTFTKGLLGGYGTVAGDTTVGTLRTVAPFYTARGDIASTLAFGAGLTLGSGGTYDWVITDAVGRPGSGWGLLAVSGPLAISAPAAPFSIQIIGAPAGFDNSRAYSWTIASATGGITGFDPSAFSLNTSTFIGSLGTGSFFLSQSDNDLVLNFTPVPEPSVYALLAVGLLMLGVAGRKRRRA